MVDSRVIDTIIAEALGEGDAGLAAVAHVILNRADARGKTPLDIVAEPHQFEGYSNPGSAAQKAMQDPKVRARVERIFTQAQSGAIPDPTNGGLYFHTPSVNPSWSDGVNKNGTTRIGNHIFYLGNKRTQPTSPDVPPPPNRQTALAAINDASPTVQAWLDSYAPQPGRMTAEPAAPSPMPASAAATARARQPSPQVQPAAAPATPQVSSTFELRQALQDYAQDYVPTSQRVAAQQSGLTTRKVPLVPVDPNTGSVATQQQVLQSALDRVAQKRAAALQQQPTVSVRAIEPGTPESRAAQLSMAANQQKPSPSSDPTWSDVIGRLQTAATTKPVAEDPIRVINQGRDLTTYGTLQPLPTTTNIKAVDLPDSAADWTGMAPPPRTNPFGDYPPAAVSSDRLTPNSTKSNNLMLGAIAALQPKVVPPLTPAAPVMTAAAPSPLPATMRPTAAAPGPMIAKPDAAPYQLGYAGLPGSELPPGANKNGTDAILAALTSPQVQTLGKVNSGQKPILNAIMRLLVPKQQMDTGRSAVATALANTGGRPGDSRISYMTSDGPRALSSASSNLVQQYGSVLNAPSWQWIMNG